LPRFRGPSGIVEAEQFFDGKPCKGVSGGFPGERKTTLCLPEGSYPIDGPSVVTGEHEVLRVNNGDWVVAHRDGIHHFPLSPREFVSMYQPVDGGAGPRVEAAVVSFSDGFRREFRNGTPAGDEAPALLVGLIRALPLLPVAFAGAIAATQDFEGYSVTYRIEVETTGG
jgi:hypothetical protein